MDLGEYPFKNGRMVISEYVDIFEHKELGKNLTRKEFEKIKYTEKRIFRPFYTKKPSSSSSILDRYVENS